MAKGKPILVIASEGKYFSGGLAEELDHRIESTPITVSKKSVSYSTQDLTPFGVPLPVRRSFRNIPWNIYEVLESMIEEGANRSEEIGATHFSLDGWSHRTRENRPLLLPGDQGYSYFLEAQLQRYAKN